MREYSATSSANMAMHCIYGEESNIRSVHREINSLIFDRWGIKFSLTLLDGTLIEGRLSNKRKFTGTVSRKGEVKRYRSFRRSYVSY